MQGYVAELGPSGLVIDDQSGSLEVDVSSKACSSIDVSQGDYLLVIGKLQTAPCDDGQLYKYIKAHKVSLLCSSENLSRTVCEYTLPADQGALE